MKQKESSGHLMALGCVLVWGSTFVVSKGLMDILQPVQLMLIRFILAYAAMWIIHPRWYFHWREEWRFLLMALFANTLYYWAENTALTLTQTSNVSILVSTTPIVTALLAVIRKEERLSRNQAIGFGIAFVGVVLVVFNGAVSLQVRLGGILFGRFDPNAADATAALANCKVPVIFAHGDADDFVPCEMSRAHYETCPTKKKLVIIPGAGHGLCYLADPEGYLAQLKDFFDSLI